MGLDKAIEHGKEKRKPYYGSKSIFGSCRNHGKCVWCERGRLHRSIRDIAACEQQLREFKEGRHEHS